MDIRDKRDEIEDSIEFVKDIKVYYQNDSKLFGNQKEHLHKDNLHKDNLHKNNLHKDTFHRRNTFQIDSMLDNDVIADDEISRLEEKVLKEEKKSLPQRILIEIIKYCLIALFSFILANQFTTYIGQYTRVNGISMENTIDNNDYLFIDKVTYREEDPKRFDIIVFPYSNNVYYIKRIIGLPSETVQIIGSTIYIDGEPLKEDYGLDPIKEAGDAAEPIHLSKDEYFVLGDNRNNSVDSRSSDVGTIVKQRIVGKAVFRIWPLHKIGKIK